VRDVGNLHQEQCKFTPKNPPGFGALLTVQKRASLPDSHAMGGQRGRVQISFLLVLGTEHFSRRHLIVMAAVVPRPDRPYVRPLAMMRNQVANSSPHLTLRFPRILVIVGVEHRDHSYRATRIPPGPVTLD